MFKWGGEREKGVAGREKIEKYRKSGKMETNLK